MRTRRSGTASALVLAATWAALAPAAADDPPEPCDERYRAKPSRDIGRGPAPLAIGDSVMWFAVEPLAKLGFRADARGCRLWPEGRRMLERRARRGTLPRRVVIALGSNWEISMDEIEETLPTLAGRHRLAIVTPREKGGGEGADARTVRRAARRHPRKIEALDWARYSRGRRGWFGSDGLHVTAKGRDAYVRCIKQALPRYRKPGHPCAPG